MPGKRPKDGKPSVYAKHLAGLLSGDSECLYATWFRSKYWYTKIEDKTFDMAAWTSDHTAMVNAQRDALVADGWTVTLESANKFELEGKAGVLVGKPDIEAAKWANGQVVAMRILDCKTGRKRNADWWQVLLYIYAKLKKQPDLLTAISGEVVYKDQTVHVHAGELNAARVAQLGATMRDVCAERAPTASPSAQACRYCDISAEYCHARYDKPAVQTAVEDF